MTRSLRLLKLKIQNEPGKSKIKRIEFEGFSQAVRMGVHSGFSEFFGVVPGGATPIDVGLRRRGGWWLLGGDACGCAREARHSNRSRPTRGGSRRAA